MLFETMKIEPRDVNRIQPFCERLAKAWEKLPDWRFGQLMVNLMRDYEAEHGHDMLHIHSMALEGSQFIIATHSPILLGMPGAQILNFSDEGVRPIRYEDTESYQITKLFLEQRESLLNKLFNGAED